MELSQVIKLVYRHHVVPTDKHSSDPSSFDIYLVKMNSYPPVNKLVAENVKTTEGSYTIDGVSADNGYAYSHRSKTLHIY